MKKHFKLQDLDCANCAAKMEDAIRKLPGVNSATVSFMTQKLTLDADDARFDEIVQEAVKICKKVEPDCTIVLKDPCGGGPEGEKRPCPRSRSGCSGASLPARCSL